MPLTKNDLIAIRTATDICIHLGGHFPLGAARLIKQKPFNAKPFESDQEFELSAKVTIRRWVDTDNATCFAMAGIYHDQFTHTSTILKSLKIGDEITFEFYPDCHSNGYVAAANLHADVLMLHVDRNGKRMSWEFDQSITPNNSARMCRGVSKTRDYERAAEDGRIASAS